MNNARDLAVVSTSAIVGALISALAFRFFSSNPKPRRSASTEISAVSRRFPGLDPYSPLKRNGFVFKLSSESSNSFFFVLIAKASNFISLSKMIDRLCFDCCEGTYHGMIISWRLHSFQLKDQRILTDRYMFSCRFQLRLCLL